MTALIVFKVPMPMPMPMPMLMPMARLVTIMLNLGPLIASHDLPFRPSVAQMPHCSKIRCRSDVLVARS